MTGPSGPDLHRPIVIIGAPRSGTTIVQACLSMHERLWHLRAESHAIFEGPFHPALRGYESNRLTRDDADPCTIRRMRRQFVAAAVNLNLATQHPEQILGAERQLDRLRALPRYQLTQARQRGHKRRQPYLRLVEKTPKNCLRIPFIECLFPDALYLVIHRDPLSNVRSLYTAWKASESSRGLRPRFGRYGYPIAEQLQLRDYTGKYWKFALVPQWQSLRGQGVAEVATWQYLQCNRYVRRDLSHISPTRVFHLRHEQFVEHPAEAMSSILQWAGLPASEAVECFVEKLPTINTVARRRDPLASERAGGDQIDAALAPHQDELRDLGRPAADWSIVGGNVSGTP